MNDFSRPRRMSPAALMIIFLKSIRELSSVSIIAIIYFLANLFRSSTINLKAIAIIAIFAIALPAIIAFFRYYFSKFHIANDKLIFTQGFGFKQTTSIPLSRVHTLRTKRGIFYRLADLRGVTFDTLSSSSQEVELILDESEWQELLQRVRAGEEFTEASKSIETLPPPFKEDLLRVSNLNILKGALCQNHLKGFAIMAAILFALFDNLSQLEDGTAGQLIRYIDQEATKLILSAIDWCMLAIAAYLFAMLLWIGKVALRYYGMSIDIADNRLTIESGLLSRYTTRIARGKATVFVIKQNPLEKMAHCQTISIRQAVNVTNPKQEERNIRIYGSDLGDKLLAWWLGDEGTYHRSPLLSAKSGKGLFMRSFLPHLFVAVAALAILIFAAEIVTAAVIICAAYAALMAIRAAMTWKHGGIQLTESHIRIDCGNIAKIHEYIRYRGVESVSIRNTPFSSVTGRVSMQISTNAGIAKVYSLKSDTATAIRNLILNQQLFI